jgi:hypothetical protein
MRRFHVCVHDATPRYASETRAMVTDLAPLIGRRLSIGVVPDWHGQWPLASHPEYCQLVRQHAEELLLHGYFHRRQNGSGPLALFAGDCDEMNGLDRAATHRLIARGQHVFRDTFGITPRGFLAPGWQRGHVRFDRSVTAAAADVVAGASAAVVATATATAGAAAAKKESDVDAIAVCLDYVLGFFALESFAGRRVPLATFAWDCGHWSWLGHVGHGVGRLLHSLDRRVPVLAIHPRDLERGFWPAILRLIEELLTRGYHPSTLAALLDMADPTEATDATAADANSANSATDAAEATDAAKANGANGANDDQSAA